MYICTVHLQGKFLCYVHMYIMIGNRHYVQRVPKNYVHIYVSLLVYKIHLVLFMKAYTCR